jgi:hypothetical protein
MDLVLVCSLTCPSCAATFSTDMPETETVDELACPSCGTVVVPDPGECCVFCSHGTMPCPIAQSEFLAMVGA